MDPYTFYIEDFPRECIDECSGPGRVDEAVEYWADKLAEFQPDPDSMRRYLSECGAWDAEELADDEVNRQRLLWLACCDFSEWDGTEDSPCGSDLVYLG